MGDDSSCGRSCWESRKEGGRGRCSEDAGGGGALDGSACSACSLTDSLWCDGLAKGGRGEGEVTQRTGGIEHDLKTLATSEFPVDALFTYIPKEVIYRYFALIVREEIDGVPPQPNPTTKYHVCVLLPPRRDKHSSCPRNRSSERYIILSFLITTLQVGFRSKVHGSQEHSYSRSQWNHQKQPY